MPLLLPLLPLLVLLIFSLLLPSQCLSHPFSPKEVIAVGRAQLQGGHFREASESFWSAIMRNDKSLDMDELKSTLELFLISYKKLNIPEEGFLKIGRQFILQGLVNEGMNYLNTALSINPKLVEAHMTLAKIPTLSASVRVQHIIKAVELDPTGYQTHLEVGAELFSLGSWDSALAMFEKSFMLNNTCWQSLASLIFLRCHVCKWGNFGSQYELDMQGIEQIIQEEIALKDSQKQIMVQAPVLYSSGQGESLVPVSETTEWVEVNEASMTSSSIHTHMLLSYAIPSELKLQVARMHTEHEQSLVRRSGLPIYSHSPDMYAEAATSPSFRIKVGYVSANFKSKTTVYMAQDLFRFHDRSKFEVHAYATTPNDNPMFLATAMGGVDWRQKVRNGVDYFHEVNGKTVKQVADLIRSHGIHILVDWDGHSNNMIRLSGLFAMQPAPIQVGHQEFIGSSGASYMQYIITDKITSPSSLQHLYSEKFIYMPNTFLANSMAYLAPHIMPPVLRRDTDVYSRQLTQGGRDSDGSGTSQAVGDNEGIVVTEKKKSRNKKKANDNGQNVHNGDSLPNNPQFNGCGGPPADFVYCNFNKHLKFSPDVFRSWLTILQNVDNSVLCLLHNPQDSEKYLMSFINDFDESLASRVRFLPFVPSPFENQKRVSHTCNAVLDTPIYNGHTCSVDALWGGVPVLVYGNSIEMASRVGMSMMSTLGLPELIARDQDDYNEIAIRLAEDELWYRSIRRRLINTCYEDSPKNPLWDLEQYVRDMEVGLEMVWENFLIGNSPQNVDVAAYKKHCKKILEDEDRGLIRSWMTNSSRSVKTKKRNNLKPLLQAIKEKKNNSAVDSTKLLQSSLQDITQGLWDILEGLDSTIEEALQQSQTSSQ